MTDKKNRILIGLVSVLVVGAVATFIAARVLLNGVEPFVRQQAIAYLSERFDADVKLASIQIQFPGVSWFRLLWTRGRGSLASVSGNGIVIRRKRWLEEPPIVSIKRFSFQVDTAVVFGARKGVRVLVLDGLELHIPPRSERPPLLGKDSVGVNSGVVIDGLRATDTLLVIHPKDPGRKPLEFRIKQLLLRSSGQDRPMSYEASLRNPRPPGQIDSKGTFGPWVREDPASTPLQGAYTFSHADLGVFKAIAGILESTGTFEGQLSRVQVHGETRVPDFRLKQAANPIALRTQFEAEVDGTNGNTTLQPIRAQLGGSRFVTSGTVVKHEDDPRRTIDLDVKMTAGRIEDFLHLAMKGMPLLQGVLRLDAKIRIPPQETKVAEKLHLAGTFDVKNGKFLKVGIQDQLDDLSRKGQGQPKNEEIDEVVSRMSGAFTMADQSIEFSRLAFGVPGADIDLAGNYDLVEQSVDFRGSMRLTAGMSQTQTGVKRLFLKPFNPFFAKNGAGTFLRIRIGGTRDKISFGLDHEKPAAVPARQ